MLARDCLTKMLTTASMRTGLVIGSLFFLSAVAGAHGQQPAVTVERIAPNRWRATYRLNGPTSALRFVRPAGFYRERIWTLTTPGYHFERDGSRQLARLDSGAAPQATIAFEFGEFTDALPKEYEFFLAFTDGGRALYTGHLQATALLSTGDSTPVKTFRLATPPGMHAVVLGRVIQGDVTLADTLEDGTYVYVGNARPIETPDVVAIVDPGMPPWLKTLFDERVPDLFRAYKRRFGAGLAAKPVVLFSFEDKNTPGLNSGGGTLAGFINMSFTGTSWATRTAAASEQAFALIAHESVHLWNGELARSRADGVGAWMHEGSADAIAAEMLRGFGVIDSTRYRTRLEEALNRCAASLNRSSIATALGRGETRVVYDCGVVLAMWTGAAARQAKPGADLLTFWRELIREAQARDGTYDEAVYFEVLKSFGVSESAVRSMRAFLTASDSVRIAVAGLRAAGITVQEGSGTPPPAYQSNAVRAAMIHLMRQACGRVSFSMGAPLHTAAVPGCVPFNAPMAVSGVQEFRVRDQGAAVYDAVAAACAGKAEVVLAGEDGARLSAVPCTATLGPRAPWFRLGPIP
jgi:hypothetical protein